MRRVMGRLAGSIVIALSAPAVVVSCAAGATSAKTLRQDRNVITAEQIRSARVQNAYEAVEALRSTWLRARGPDSFNTSSPVLVYMNGTRAGDVETLRLVAAPLVTFIRYYDGVEATSRWGVGHGAGVIFVSTSPGGKTPRDTARDAGSNSAHAGNR